MMISVQLSFLKWSNPTYLASPFTLGVGELAGWHKDDLSKYQFGFRQGLKPKVNIGFWHCLWLFPVLFYEFSPRVSCFAFHFLPLSRSRFLFSVSTVFHLLISPFPFTPVVLL